MGESRRIDLVVGPQPAVGPRLGLLKLPRIDLRLCRPLRLLLADFLQRGGEIALLLLFFIASFIPSRSAQI